jgi:transposase
MPAFHGHPRRRPSDGAVVHDCDRRSVALSPFARPRRSFWLTSRRWQSGSSIDAQGRISKARDADMRRALYEAAAGLITRFKGSDKVKSWGRRSPNATCHRKACVAMARKLAVIMHSMWTDGTAYVGDSVASHTDAAQRAHAKHRKLLGAHR